MKAKHTGIFFYVPSVFHAELFPELDGLDNEAYWLVHRIVAGNSRQKHANTSHVNISHQTMREFIHPSKVKLVLKTLLDAHVIESNGKFQPGVHSTGYRLGEAYKGELRQVEVRKRIMAGKMVRHRIKVQHRPVDAATLEANHAYLFDWLRKVKIDKNRAVQIIDDPHHGQRKLGRRGRTRLVSAYTRALNVMTVDQLASGALDFTVCDYGRVHTPVTRLPTEARACLSFDGEPVVNIDIANSQMIFSVCCCWKHVLMLLLLLDRLGGHLLKMYFLGVYGEIRGERGRGTGVRR